MKPINYTYKQKKKASTSLALGLSEIEAAETLIINELFRESVTHMYFTSYYISQSLLVDQLGKKLSHKNIERQLHKVYGKHAEFPRSYVDLHSFLHNFRTEFSYRTAHVPNPTLVKRKLAKLKNYVKFAYKVVPKIETLEIVQGIYESNKTAIKDFSYDIYCPKTYSHHTRVTFWQPPFYAKLYPPERLQNNVKKLLRNMKVRKVKDYVVGLNSRLDQYNPVHLIQLDIDTLDSSVESSLKEISGILLKTGRGFHFIGNNLIIGQKEWVSFMKKMRRHKVLKIYIDKDHIDISLKRGYSTLRITSSPIKPSTPVFYKEL